MIIKNNKYLKNFSKHRNKIFLKLNVFKIINFSDTSRKKNLSDNKIKNLKDFLNFFEFNEKNYKKPNYPFYDNVDQHIVDSKNLISNKQKLNDFLYSLEYTNKLKILYFLEVSIKLFKNIHINRISFEIFTILFLFVYFFKLGTFF